VTRPDLKQLRDDLLLIVLVPLIVSIRMGAAWVHARAKGGLDK
jgi:hypothetical protein